MRRGKFFQKPASWGPPGDTHQMMDAPLDAGRDDAGAEPTRAEPGPVYASAESEHNCWAQCMADIERAVALIRRDARRLHVPASDVDDAVQDGLYQAWLKRVEHDRTRPLVPWLRGFGRRVILARLLARSLDEDAEPDVPEPADVPSQREQPPEATAEMKEIRERLRALLGQAPSRYREILLARYWEGLCISAVADRLGQSPKAVRRCLDRALVWLEAGWLGVGTAIGSSPTRRKIQESEGKNGPPFG